MKIDFTEREGLKIRWTCFGITAGLAIGFLFGGFFESAAINLLGATSIFVLLLIYEG